MRFFRERAYLLLLFMPLLLFCLYLMQGSLSSMRISEELAEQSVLEAATPESFGVTVLLAGFRGIFADLLWLRAIDKQDKEEYFESQALFETICRLQPTFEHVWAFAGWNLAYNISFEEPSLDRKYEWIKAGLNLIREGFARNPKSYFLAHQVGSVYFYKLAEQPVYKEWIFEETGQSPYEIAFEWFQMAADPTRFPRHTQIQDKAVPRALGKLAEEAQERGDTLLELERLERTLSAWESYGERYPDDVVPTSQVFKITRRLGSVYAEAANLKAQEGDSEARLSYLGKALDLVRNTRAPDLENPDLMLTEGRVLYELARAKSAVGDESETMDYLDGSATLAHDARDTWVFLYEVLVGRPEYLASQADALYLLSEIAKFKNERREQLEFLSQAVELDRGVLIEVETYGSSGKRGDYAWLEKQIRNEVLPQRLQELEQLKGLESGQS